MWTANASRVGSTLTGLMVTAGLVAGTSVRAHAQLPFNWETARPMETVSEIKFAGCRISESEGCTWTMQGRPWTVRFPKRTIVAIKTRVYYRQINFDNLRCSSPGIRTARCAILVLFDDNDTLLVIYSPLGAQVSQSWGIERPTHIRN